MQMVDSLFGLDKVHNPALRAPPPPVPEPKKVAPVGPTDAEKQQNVAEVQAAFKNAGTILGNAWKNRNGEKP